jgi:hypothetical protein
MDLEKQFQEAQTGSSSHSIITTLLPGLSETLRNNEKLGTLCSNVH